MIWYSPELNLILHCKVRLGNHVDGTNGVHYELTSGSGDEHPWNEEVMMSTAWYFVGLL